MQRRILIALVLIGLLIGIVAMSRPLFAQEEVIKLNFWHAMGGHNKRVLDELVDKFNKTHPKIQITATNIRSRDERMGNDYKALYKTILENLAKKTPPDIAQVYENWTTQLMDIGVIIPIQDYVGKGNIISPEDVNDLVPIFREANTNNGKLWTMPFNKSIYVLYYNKDLFKQAGVSAPPTSWDEFREVSRKLTRRNGEQTAVYGLAFYPSVDIFGHYLYAYNGNFLNGSKVAFNSDVGIKNLDYWVTLVHKDRSALVSFNDKEEFMSQRSAMFLGTTSGLGFLSKSAKFGWSVAPLPKGSTTRYQFAGTNLAIFSHLSPEKRKAAATFISWLTNKENTTYWALNTGYLPVRQSSINGMEYQHLLQSDPRYKVGIDALKYAVIQPKVAEWEMIRGLVDDAMFEAISLRSTPQNALERAAQMAEHLIRNITGG